MFYGMKDRYSRLRFSRACAGILDTPPVRVDPASALLLFTQLQHKDVLLALLAFKSFASRVRVGAMCILDDGSLTAEDRTLLSAHLPGVMFVDPAPVQSPACPSGGCWERLLWIARLSTEHYVIQLDSDTLALGDMSEVAACVEAGRSFVIGTWDRQELEPMSFRQSEAHRLLAAQAGEPHVQLLAEGSFDHIEGYEQLRYVRGCAGFCGFARGSVDRRFIERVSGQMEQALGPAWRRWGSEQVMSNIVVANTPGAFVLPHPKYCDCTRLRPGTTTFVHFIGSCRFTGDVYQNRAREVIAALAAQEALA